MTRKDTTEYRKLKDEELIVKRDELRMLIIGSHRGIRPILPLGQKEAVKRKIARINTILNERRGYGTK